MSPQSSHNGFKAKTLPRPPVSQGLTRGYIDGRDHLRRAGNLGQDLRPPNCSSPQHHTGRPRANAARAVATSRIPPPA